MFFISKKINNLHCGHSSIDNLMKKDPNNKYFVEKKFQRCLKLWQRQHHIEARKSNQVMNIMEFRSRFCELC